ncbi:VOC family protein [Halorussus sp. AFM4]|uniref:VOC family protein n=1 Tax=Halorussus sp. AFM4 TaxID=3421651 RepID=UPI003EBD9EDF
MASSWTATFYCDLLDGELREETSVDGRVDLGFIQTSGGKVELITRNERGAYLDDLLDEIQDHSQCHVAYPVPDIATSKETLEDRGIELYDCEPVDGTGAYVRAFVAPGVPIELVDLNGAEGEYRGFGFLVLESEWIERRRSTQPSVSSTICIGTMVSSSLSVTTSQANPS